QRVVASRHITVLKTAQVVGGSAKHTASTYVESIRHTGQRLFLGIILALNASVYSGITPVRSRPLRWLRECRAQPGRRDNYPDTGGLGLLKRWAKRDTGNVD